MATVSDLIHSSMRLIGAIAAGETLETNELNDAFVSLNEMISSWNTEGASLPGRDRMEVSLQQGVNSYQLSSRPNQIVAGSSSLSGVDSQIELVDAAGYEAVQEKAMQSVYIRKLYCNYQWPISAIYLWPTPRTGGLLELWITSPMLPFNSLSDVVALPDGYEAGLRCNLAVLLAPEYGRPLDQVVLAAAQNFKASLVQLNSINQMRSPQPPVQPIVAPPQT
jgi:hypothetical protein